MLNWLFSLLISSALAANFAPFQANYVSSTLFTTSVPLGNFKQNTHTNATVVTNADGTTLGVNTSGSCFSAMSTFVTFPTDDVYTFTVEAYSFTAITVANQNSLQVAIDGFTIPAVGYASGNYFTLFITNSAPVAPYVFQAPIQAGTHLVGVGLCTAQSQALSVISTGVHGDRVNIAATGVGIQTEPSPQTRDPYLYPMSSFDFINTAIGSGATFTNSSDPVTIVINGLASTINSTCFSVPLYQGQAGDPVGTYTLNDTTYLETWYNGTYPFSLHINTSDTVDPCSDSSIGLGSYDNHRFFYFGSNPGTVTVTSGVAAVTGGIGGTIDTYRQWPSISENQQVPGLIRAQDITDGVISHSLILGLTYVSTVSGGNYSTLTQLGWPVNNYDYSCFVGSPTNCTGTIPPGITVALPSSVNCSTIVSSVGGQMLCLALQNYGATHDVQSGSPTSPGFFLYAEAAAASGATATTLSQMVSALPTLVAQLVILTNNTPTTFYTGNGVNTCAVGGCAKGGGTPLVAMRPGLIQGLASVVAPPAPPPSQTPVQIAGVSYGNASGACLTTNTAVPVGGSVFFLGVQQNATLGSFAGATDNGTGGSNTYSIAIQQTNSSVPTPAIIHSLNITHALPAGSQICITGSFGTGGTWIGTAWAATGVNGGLDKTAQQSNTSAKTFNFISPTLSQSNELVLFLFNGQTNLGVIVENLSGTEMFDGVFTGATNKVQTTGGTVTYSPSWNGNASITQAVMASYKIP